MPRNLWTLLLAGAVLAACVASVRAEPRELYYNSCDSGNVVGVVGKASKGVSEEARGKIDMDRGTISYFFQPAKTIEPWEWGGLTLDVAPAFDGYWGMMFALNLRGTMWGVDLLDASRYCQRLNLPSPVGRWKGGEWVHVAIVWDRDQGIKYYENGKVLAGNWGKNRWAWSMVPGWLDVNGPGAVDEVHIYGDCLTDEQVAQLSKAQPVTGNAIPTRASTERRADDLARMGWSDEDLKQVPALAPDAPLAFTFARIIRSSDEGNIDSKVFDGIRDTGWPNPTRNVSLGRLDRRIDITLAPDQSYDRMVLFAQRPFTGLIGRFSADVGFMPITRIQADHSYWRFKFDKPMVDTSLSLTRSAGWIGEIGFYRVDALSKAPADASLQKLGSLAGLPQPLGPGEGALAILAETPSRFWSCVEPKAEAVAAWQMTTPEFGGFQVLSQPLAEQGAFDGVMLTLVTEKMQGPTPVRVLVKEPITALRDWMQADVVLTPKGDGRQTFQLLLKGRPVLNQAGMQLPVMITAANPVTWAMGQGGSSISLCLADKAKVRQIAVDDQVDFARDNYSESSEPRSSLWGKPGLRWPAGYWPLKWLYDYALDDPRAYQLNARIEKFKPMPPPPAYADPVNNTGAPEWAFWQMQAINGVNGMLHWWIDHRQAPTGELGFTWNDDTDLMECWTGAALGYDTDDQKVKNAMRKLWDHIYTDQMEHGASRTIRDDLHAYEEGTGFIAIQQLVDYGDPVAFERTMVAASNLKDWSKTNEDGTWSFRGWYMGAPGVWDYGPFAGDHKGSWLLVDPAAYIFWYNRNPTASWWITHWKQNGAPYSTDPVGQANVRTLDPRKQEEVFADWAGGMAANLKPGIDASPLHLSNALENFNQLPETLWKEKIAPQIVNQFVAGRDLDALMKGPLTLISDGLYSFRQTDEQWLAYRATGDTRWLAHSYRQVAMWFNLYTWLHTIGCTNGDRVVLQDTAIVRARLGAYPSYRSGDYNWWPNHGISYEVGGEHMAALVGSNSDTKFSARFFAFTDKPLDLTARLWRLQPGTYKLTLAPDKNDDGKADDGAAVLEQREIQVARGGSLKLTLPAKQEVVLTIEAVKAAPFNYDRPDPAVSVRAAKVDYGEHVQVDVYNLGSKPAENVLVRMTDPRSGNVVYETRVSHIDAVKEFAPSKARVEFQNVNEVTYGAIVVEVDPEHEIDDMNPYNNRIVVRY